ncbi:MAG: SIS domain-containing protein [Verrucomicrobia bacterium]|nr:SIS domain-containing protein [Verrucomicrobiota bacterium]MBU1909217.1 SIS domain-containing protein [Verrucomicrobiota bacterium]
MATERLEQYLETVVQAARRVDLRTVERFIDLLEAAYREDRAVYVIGNGGSAANASHFAEDLSMGAMPDLEGKRFRVLSLTDNTSFITALANDKGYDRIFDLQLRQFARKGDLLVVISGSGNSPNVVRAAEYARSLGMIVVAVTGFDGGKMKSLADLNVHVPHPHMCRTEAIHAILLHLTADLLRERLIGPVAPPATPSRKR